MSLRVLVLADDPFLRGRLAGRVERLPGFVVAGDGAPGEDLPGGPADVALWDLGSDRETALVQIASLPDLPWPVVLLGPAGLTAGALAAGARGYLGREPEEARLAAALQAAAAGLQVLEPSGLDDAAGEAPVDELTPREMEVLQHLAEGLPNKEIARRLRISEHTVKFHVNTILGKLGARTRTEAVTRAARQGLIIL